MKIYDISVLINSELAVWPGDPAVEIIQAASIANGDGYNLSRFNISAHTGTHIDAPLHFLKDGNTIGVIPMEQLIGKVQVIEIPEDIQRIDKTVLDQFEILPGIERILFKTKNSKYWGKGPTFHESYVALDSSGAKRIVELGIKLVGIDYLSIAIFKDIIQPHEILLSNGIVLLESCDLSEVPAGQYELICLPLKVNELEGAPVRAILLSNEISLYE